MTSGNIAEIYPTEGKKLVEFCGTTCKYQFAANTRVLMALQEV